MNGERRKRFLPLLTSPPPLFLLFPFFHSARLAAVIISAMVMFAGYVIPRFGMPRWLFWGESSGDGGVREWREATTSLLTSTYTLLLSFRLLPSTVSYLNPLYFGFAALMINEFKDLDLSCVDTYITPRNVDGTLPQYPNSVGDFQVCTLPGSSPAQQSVPGMDYLNASFGYQRSDLWLDFGVVLIFFAGLVTLTCIVIEVFQHGKHSSALKVGKKPNADEQAKNAALKARRANKDEEKGEEEEAKLDINACTFTWEDLNYTVPVKGGDRQLLNSVYGFCKPGSLTALMVSLQRRHLFFFWPHLLIFFHFCSSLYFREPLVSLKRRRPFPLA